MALTESKNFLEKYDPAGYREDVLATNAVQYYKGGLVGIDSTTGLLVKLTNAVTVRAVYICEDEILAVTGDFIGVRSGIFKFLNGDSIADSDRGKRAFMGANGDGTVYKAGDPITEALVGTIEGVDGATAPGGAGVWVKLRGTNVITKPLTATTGDNLSGS
jgi:hypothetical protein